MLSIAWDGDEAANQAYGCTDLTLEPFWAGCPEKHFHTGIDIGSPACKGKALYAARAGTVTALSWGILGIHTGSGETDFYVHGTYSVTWGQAVARGQMVGAFGDRVPSGGYLTGPHLHFEVQAPGGALNHPLSSRDPLPILQALSGAGSHIQEVDMTQDEHDTLLFIKEYVARNFNLDLNGQDWAQLPPVAGTRGSGAPPFLKAELDAIKAGQVAPSAPDLSGLTNAVSALTATVGALAASVAEVKADVKAVRSKTDADLK